MTISQEFEDEIKPVVLMNVVQEITEVIDKKHIEKYLMRKKGNMMNTELLSQKLNWRYAVKKFDPTKSLSDKQWAGLEKSLILSPSSYGLQPWKFIVVTNLELKQQLRRQELDSFLYQLPSNLRQ